MYVSDEENKSKNNGLCDDIFLMRLKLLLIMCGAYLRGEPVGEGRKAAIIANARHVAAGTVDWGGLVENFRSAASGNGPDQMDAVFFQRVKLLALMATAFARGQPMGYFRKKAIEENVRRICQRLEISQTSISETDISDVA